MLCLNQISWCDFSFIFSKNVNKFVIITTQKISKLLIQPKQKKCFTKKKCVDTLQRILLHFTALKNITMLYKNKRTIPRGSNKLNFIQQHINRFKVNIIHCHTHFTLSTAYKIESNSNNFPRFISVKKKIKYKIYIIVLKAKLNQESITRKKSFILHCKKLCKKHISVHKKKNKIMNTKFHIF